MSFANSSYSDIIATTIQSRSGKIADNVTDNNAVLTWLSKRGNVRPFSGGNVILRNSRSPTTATRATTAVTICCQLRRRM